MQTDLNCTDYMIKPIPKCIICYSLVITFNSMWGADLSWLYICVYRWVRWTWLVQYWDHSLTSRGLVTCHWTAKVTCWLLTMAITAFCCWTVNWNCNASSLTTTLKSSRGSQGDSVIMNVRNSCTFYTEKQTSQCSASAESCWLINPLPSPNPSATTHSAQTPQIVGISR